MPSAMREREGGRAAPELTIQAEIGGKTVAFVELIGSCDEEKLNERVDMYRRVIERQVNRQRLKETLIDLVAARKTLTELPDRLKDALTAITIDRAAFWAGKELAHARANKRGDYAKSIADEREGAKFTDQMAAKETEFEKLREQLTRSIPELEAQVTRLARAVEGEDQLEQLRADLAKYSEGPLAIAAE